MAGGLRGGVSPQLPLSSSPPLSGPHTSPPLCVCLRAASACVSAYARAMQCPYRSTRCAVLTHPVCCDRCSYGMSGTRTVRDTVALLTKNLGVTAWNLQVSLLSAYAIILRYDPSLSACAISLSYDPPIRTYAMSLHYEPAL
eukprot:3453270-Rhodomonas_salina.2